MHTAERVALWVIITLIVFFLFFKQTSGFTNRQMNLMSLAEFKGVPQPLKDAYVQNMSPIVDALSEKITKEWNGINPMDQQKALAQLAGMSQQIVSNIKQAPNLAAAVNPGTHANVPAPPAMPVSVPAPQPMKI